MVRENRLNRTIEDAQADSLSVGQHSSFLISDNMTNPTYAYLVQYSFIRCAQYARLSEEEDVLLFESEGLKFAIQGKNIFQLMRMINLRRLSEICKNQTIRFNSLVIEITGITVEPMKGDD